MLDEKGKISTWICRRVCSSLVPNEDIGNNVWLIRRYVIISSARTCSDSVLQIARGTFFLCCTHQPNNTKKQRHVKNNIKHNILRILRFPSPKLKEIVPFFVFNYLSIRNWGWKENYTIIRSEASCNIGRTLWQNLLLFLTRKNGCWWLSNKNGAKTIHRSSVQFIPQDDRYLRSNWSTRYTSGQGIEVWFEKMKIEFLRSSWLSLRAYPTFNGTPRYRQTYRYGMH